MTTIKDIAKLAGVSPSLVSRAFNEGQVSEKSKKKIFEAAEKLNYTPKYSARSLRTGKAFSVGLYIMNLPSSKIEIEKSEYLYPLIVSISSVLIKRGYSLQFEQILIDGTEQERITQKVLTRSVDGIILFNAWADIDLSIISTFIQKDFPFVLLNPVYPHTDVNSVYIDNYHGGIKAFQYLLDKGHRDIGVISGPSNNNDSIQRFKGFKDCSQQNNVLLREDWIKEGDFSIEDGSRCMSNILIGKEYPTAIFCVNDFMAMGAIQAIKEKGLRIPEDISILGYDDHIVAQASFPKLTTFQQPLLTQGRQCVEILLQLIEGNSTVKNKKAIDPTLIERDSVLDLND